jgi:hypothetical protein
LSLLLYISGYAAVLIVWPVSIGAVAVVAERNYGASLGRSLWIAFAVVMTGVVLMAVSAVEMLNV